MSANNWTRCPKCQHNANSQYRENALALVNDYGKIPSAVFLERVKTHEKNTEDVLAGGNVLREDFEIGICDGIFEIGYSAHCDRCGFKFEYTFECDPLNKAAQ